jgi:hypothetical protein
VVRVHPDPPLEHTYGALAQLGEHLLCKQRVVGSIPTGSTSLRRLRLLRLGKPMDREGCRAGARKSGGGLIARPSKHIRPRDNTSHLLVLTGTTEDCVLSDIVKRRSIRVGVVQWSVTTQVVRVPTMHGAFTISGSFRRKLEAVKHPACCK